MLLDCVDCKLPQSKLYHQVKKPSGKKTAPDKSREKFNKMTHIIGEQNEVKTEEQ